MKYDTRYKIIGHKHRALSRYYMILNRLKNSHRKKNRTYKDLEISLDKDSFVEWFMLNDFEGCSVDRIDNKKGYSLDNLQLISLESNIRKDKIKAKDGFCECFCCHELKNINDMVVDRRRKNGHGTCCKSCDSKRKKR